MPQPMTTTGDPAFSACGDSVTPRDLSAVPALELQIVEQQAGQPALDGTSPEEAHHLQQHIPGKIDRDAPTVAVGGDGGKGATSHLRHVLLRHRTLNIQ